LDSKALKTIPLFERSEFGMVPALMAKIRVCLKFVFGSEKVQFKVLVK